MCMTKENRSGHKSISGWDPSRVYREGSLNTHTYFYLMSGQPMGWLFSVLFFLDIFSTSTMTLKVGWPGGGTNL